MWNQLTEIWPDRQLPAIDRDQFIGGTDLQRQWRAQGVVVCPGIADAGLIDAYCNRWLQDNQGHPGGYDCAVPYRHVPQLLELVTQRSISDRLQEIIGEPMAVHLALSGWVSTERDWHQDGYLNPAHVRDWYAAVWIALDDVDPGSGPFEYVPGTHRWPHRLTLERMLEALAPHQRGVDWPRHSERILTPIYSRRIADQGLQVQQFLGQKGDVLFWHPRTLHRGSVPNNRSLLRPALIAHFSGTDHRPDMPPAQRYGDGWQFPILQCGRCAEPDNPRRLCRV